MSILMYLLLAFGFIVTLGFAGLTGIVLTLFVECIKKGDTLKFKLSVVAVLVLCAVMTVAAGIMMIDVCRSIIF